jgi:hypothetical protein
MLPETEHEPSGFHESLICVAVTLNVAQHFFGPISRVRSRRNIVLRAAMPIAAVDEHGNLRWAEYHVCRSAKVWERAGGHAVSQPLSVN